MSRILVVDDTPEVLDLVVACLSRDGYDISKAETLTEARAALASDIFDAVVTDVELPDGNGMEIMPLLGTKRPRTRVIVMTAHVDTERAIHALQAGAYDFLSKPIERDVLRSSVRRAVEAVHLESEIEAHNRELEVRVMQRTAELEEANRRLEESRDQMIRAEKMATIGCIAAGVAHEINNPIGFINSNLATLKNYLAEIKPVIDGRVDAFIVSDLDQLVRESEDGVKRVVKIVRDLKTFSHVSTGKQEPTDLDECASVAINLCRSETKHHADVVHESGNVPPITAWSSEITQVLVNLVANAAQAIASQERTTPGRITVRTRADGPWAVLEVEDDGPGIPPGIVGRVFDPFFTTKEAGKGTGLGLSLSSEIVERHRGELSVRSTVGEGACFVMRLPLLPAVSDARIPELENRQEPR